MKVAIVQDWFVVNGGAEKVVKELVALYPNADVYGLIDFLSEEDRQDIVAGKKITTSFLQHFPYAKQNYRNWLLLFPLAIESLDLSAYDVIISSSYAVAKGVKKLPHQLHICYCHSPIRYAWDLQDEYLSHLGNVKKWLAKPILAYIRYWDIKTLNRVDVFLANSKYIADRIKRIYKRDAQVVYPPINIEEYVGTLTKKEYYFTSARLVAYKKIDLIIKAFNQMPHLKLVVGGNGPDLVKLKQLANHNISFTGFLPKAELTKYMQESKAFILAANEDFGITSIEAQSCYTPVIALKMGGYLETVVENKTGFFFDEQTAESIKSCVLQFEQLDFDLNPAFFKKNITMFSRSNFINTFTAIIQKHVSAKG